MRQLCDTTVLFKAINLIPCSPLYPQVEDKAALSIKKTILIIRVTPWMGHKTVVKTKGKHLSSPAYMP